MTKVSDSHVDPDAEHAVLAPHHHRPRRAFEHDDDVVAPLPRDQRVGVFQRAEDGEVGAGEVGGDRRPRRWTGRSGCLRGTASAAAPPPAPAAAATARPASATLEPRASAQARRRSANRGWRRAGRGRRRAGAPPPAPAAPAARAAARRAASGRPWRRIARRRRRPTIRRKASTTSTVWLVGGVHERRVGRDEDDLEQRGADDDVGRHLQQIDQRRHHDEAAADAHDRRQEADAGAEAEHRDDADEELRGAEAHLQRQAVDPVVLARAASASAPRRRRGAPDRVDALHQHQPADRAEEDDVEQRDDEIELAEPAQAA